MNLTNVKAENERVEVFDGLSLGIQNYGLKNDYPQKIKSVTDASVTARGCLQTYSKFLQGKGFADPTFYKAQINSSGDTCDQLLNWITKDISDYGGFALHVNYNLLSEITDVNYIPFEHCRLSIEDDKGKVSKIALHRDWTKKKRNTRITNETIEFIDTFNPIKEVVQAQITASGGIDNYKGQVLYYTMDGGMYYPTPVYDSAITDISTEAGISNVMYRNTRYNFMAAGMLIRKKVELGGKDNEPVDDSFSKNFKQFQGDENACKIIDVEVEAEEVKPEYVPFEVKERADEMKTTSAMVSEKIGKCFLQPPILRAESVATGFTLQAMKDAYDFYNSVTQPERIELERVFQKIFSRFFQPVNPTMNFSILPLTYGTDNVQ